MDVESSEGQALSGPLQPRLTLTRATYYLARRDARRCAFPACGGFWVSAVNQKVTRCLDGSYSDECYVSRLGYSRFDGPAGAERTVQNAMGIDIETSRVVLLGTMTGRILGQDVLNVQMAWVALESLPIRGDFYKVTTNGIVCIAAPCPSYDEEVLNRGTTGLLHGFDFSDVPPHDNDGTYTVPALASRYGLVVSGENVIDDAAGPAGSGTFLKASQVFIPLTRRESRVLTRTWGTPIAPLPSE